MNSIRVTGMVTLVAALLAPSVAEAAVKGQERKAVVPVLECVLTHDDGTYTASFGYLNGNRYTINLAAGSDANDFSPSPDARGQTTTFSPGRGEHAFSVTSPTAVDLKWTLDGSEVRAGAYSRPCVTTGRMQGSRVRTFWTNGTWKTDRWGLKASFDLPCSLLGPRKLEVRWNEDGQPENVFKLNLISFVFCWNDPILDPGRPAAGFDSSLGVGLGTLNGKPAAIEWLVTDRGERSDHRHWGRAVDRAGFIIRDSSNAVVLAKEARTLEGNVEAQS